MRDQERERLKVLEQMAAWLIGTDQGAARLGVRRRQAQRLPADDRRRGDRAAIPCVQERRTVANDWTVSIDGMAWRIEPGERTGALRGRRVIVERRRDGGLRLRWGDRYLTFRRAAGALEQKLALEKKATEKRAVDFDALWTAGPWRVERGFARPAVHRA